MSIKTEQVGEGNARAVVITCDEGRSEGCRRTYEVETRFESTGGDARWAITQAVANRWQHFQRERAWVDVCPACAAEPDASI